MSTPRPLSTHPDLHLVRHDPDPKTVSVLRWEDERAVAAVLADAFVDDPLVMAICPGTVPERRRRIWWSFRVAVRGHYLAKQPAWTTLDPTGTPESVVLAIRPYPAQPQISDFAFALRSLLRMGIVAAVRGARAAQIIAAHAPPQPFTYLRTLGVDPKYQGRGRGSRLVESVIQSAPAAFPIYLETAKEQNLSFYARHGVSCSGEFTCIGVRVWRLLRAARVGHGLDMNREP